MKQKLICLTGLSGAGKSTALEFFTSKDIATFYTGDIIPAHIDELCKIDYGDSFETPQGFIETVISEAMRKNPSEELVVIDSLRSLEELEYVRGLPFHTYLVALLCGHNVRRQRLQERDGDFFPKVERRDRKDLGLESDSRYNVGVLVTQADYFIDNSYTKSYTCQQLERMLEEIEHD